MDENSTDLHHGTSSPHEDRLGFRRFGRRPSVSRAPTTQQRDESSLMNQGDITSPRRNKWNWAVGPVSMVSSVGL